MINLLPPQCKKELKEEENWKLISILNLLFLFFLISFSLILFAIKIYIQGQVESLKALASLEEKGLQISETQELKERIFLTNQNIVKLNSFYQNQINSIEILEKISQTLPSGVYLTAFSWQKKNRQISFSGYAPTREILFEFRKNLKEQKQFGEIDVTSPNLYAPTDIKFTAVLKFEFPK